MAFSGFGKNSGPSGQPGAQYPFGNFPRHPSPSSPLPTSARSSVDYRDLHASEGIPSPLLASARPFPGSQQRNEPPLAQGYVKASSLKDSGAQYQSPPAAPQQVASKHVRSGGATNTAEVKSIRITKSPISQSPHVSNTSGSPMGSDMSYLDPSGARLPRPVFHNSAYVDRQRPHVQESRQRPFSPWNNQSNLASHNITPPTQERVSPALTTGGTYQPRPMSTGGTYQPRPMSRGGTYQPRPMSTGGTYQPRPMSTGGTYQPRPVFQTKHVDAPLQKRSRSPTLPAAIGFSPENGLVDGHNRSIVDYRDLDAPEAMALPQLDFKSSIARRESSRAFGGVQKPIPSSLTYGDRSKSSVNNTTLLVQEDMSGALTKGSYQSGGKLQAELVDVQLPKRTRSPTIPSPNGNFVQNPASVFDNLKRGPGLQRRSTSPTSLQANSAEDDVNKPMNIPAVKRSKIPRQSPDLVYQENLEPEQEIEREMHAKAKRLARFKDELSQPEPSRPTVKNPKDPAKSQPLSMSEKQKFSEDLKMDMMVDSAGGIVSSDYEGRASSTSIVGLCPDMCPGSERSERERKGDLDQYERLDGDRNLTSEFLAVKKYTRTAEREAQLIRPLPILQKTIHYLLNLLDEPYDDRFLGLYNFLWDRMRAIRMDLRMQHIFNLEAITMLEQMIRLHIIAMHELCEYTKGEGFSEGFDAHLNIEQMNKTSVELFQFYDDHRKKGIHVPSEREFRGYYALLKLDKHPGYKVEPAELSLDLAKMTQEMRQTPEVLFARDVARACRTGNFIAFFRLARKASYLQACLMHAHFSKLRTQALGSLHCGVQINQGIPISHVAKWLGMEEEDIGDLLEYHGFSVRDFEEPYMVKENTFLNAENDFPVKRSKLVEMKRSEMIVADVMFPSLAESHADNKVREFQLKKDSHPRPALPPIVAVSTPQLHDAEMHDFVSRLSPKGSIRKPVTKAPMSPNAPDQRNIELDKAPISPTSAGPVVSDFSKSSPKPHDSVAESAKSFKYEPAFRNSFGRSMKHDIEATSTVTPQTIVSEVNAEEDRFSVTPPDSVVHSTIQNPTFSEETEDEELTEVVEEDTTDEATTSNYDLEVLEAKLRLMLRIWKRRTSNRRKLREHKKFNANAALDLLSLGPPIWQLEDQSCSIATFDIDHVMRERYETQQRSTSVMNPSEVVASKLLEKNPDAKCISWKLVLCSQEVDTAQPTACSWLLSKLMPSNNDGSDDLIVSSHDLAIWRSWTPSQSDDDLACCLSVIKSMNSEIINDSITGANAIIFLLSERISLDLQRKQLHDLVMLIPSNSRLPLLILSVSVKDESDLANIAKVLGIHEIDKSRVSISCFTSLKDDERGLDGFFSDTRLREGLEWLSHESPPQIVVSRAKTREWVLSHLNTTLKTLDAIDIHRVSPNDCISVYNEALDRSMNEVATTAHANPTNWPCPEIDLLEEFTDEFMAVKLYLPSVGWSSPARTQVLMSALNDCKLPPWEDDLSWLSRGLGIGGEVGKQKSRLENCLVNYLTEIMGEAMALKEAAILLQNFTFFELHNTNYYITPRWVSIFRRIFNWRLMKLNSEELSSTYIRSTDILDSLESEDNALFIPYVAQPSFDEMVEVGLESNEMDLESSQPPSSMAPDYTDLPSSSDQAILIEDKNPENDMLTSYDNSATQENEEGSAVMPSSKAPTDADKLSELLEKCNIIQNMIDKKLSIYF